MGWLVKFKRRNNIRLVRLYGEKASADEDAAQRFVAQFKKEIEEEDLNMECVYNMDESGLLWKALPQKSLVRNQEGCVSGYKEKKEWVSIAFCANANGTHKIKPFFIHKYKKPRALKYCLNQLPVDYASQRNAWMDQKLFMEWFNHFKNSVELFQMQKGISSKVILLVDNCSAHKFPANYNMENCNIELRYLPANTTSLIQPMDQGVIEKTKRCFRHKLMQRVVSYPGGVNEFYKKYTIKDCIDMVADVWENVTSSNIKNSWNNLLPDTRNCTEVGREGEEDEDEDEGEEARNCIIEEMQEIMSQISPHHNITTEDVSDFLDYCNEAERKENEDDGTNDNEDEGTNENEDEGTNENKDEGTNEDESTGENRVQDGAQTSQVRGIPLNAEERQELENHFRGIEKFDDRAPYPLRMHTQLLKLYYLGKVFNSKKLAIYFMIFYKDLEYNNSYFLGDNPKYDRPIHRRQDG